MGRVATSKEPSQRGDSMQKRPHYPTPEHRRIVETLTAYYSKWRSVYAVVVVGSLATGMCDADSDIDMTVLTDGFDLKKYALSNEIRFRAYEKMGASVDWEYRGIEEFLYFGNIRVDVNFSTGNFRAFEKPFDTRRDEFELSVGNVFIHSAPVYMRGDNKFEALREKLVPYYDEKLAERRLKSVVSELEFRLSRTLTQSRKGNQLEAERQLIMAWEDYVQAFFIFNKKYPLSYSKWIEYQSDAILNSHELISAYTDFMRPDAAISERCAAIRLRLRTLNSEQSRGGQPD